jgi:hypothetical protein
MVAHHAFAVVADVPNADIVPPNDEDIWLASSLSDLTVCARRRLSLWN